MMMNFDIELFDRNPDRCQALRHAFKSTKVPVIQSSLQDLFENHDYDCLVSPANSFGIMDGGLDQVITDLYGPALQDRVQNAIRQQYFGEQPVGTCLMIQTDVERHPYIAHAPTMRVPMQITRTDNVYNAMRAVLMAAQFTNAFGPKIGLLLCPGLGMGAGKMPPEAAAHQMRLAWDSVQPDHIAPQTWTEADGWQSRLGFGLGGDPDHF